MNDNQEAEDAQGDVPADACPSASKQVSPDDQVISPADAAMLDQHTEEAAGELSRSLSYPGITIIDGMKAWPDNGVLSLKDKPQRQSSVSQFQHAIGVLLQTGLRFVDRQLDGFAASEIVSRQGLLPILAAEAHCLATAKGRPGLRPILVANHEAMCGIHLLQIDAECISEAVRCLVESLLGRVPALNHAPKEAEQGPETTVPVHEEVHAWMGAVDVYEWEAMARHKEGYDAPLSSLILAGVDLGFSEESDRNDPHSELADGKGGQEPEVARSASATSGAFTTPIQASSEKEADALAPGAPLARGTFIALSGLVKDGNTTLKGVDTRFSILTKPMPLTPPADPDEVWQTLERAAPWMSEANAAVAEACALARHVGADRLLFKPLLLVGLPGGGKSSWGRKAAAALGIKSRILPLGGSHSSVVVTGTERGWSTATPCFMARAMVETESPDPLIVADEIDKVGESRHNGNAIDALLPLLEHETARRHHDTCLQGQLDASAISWVLTANSLAGLPPTLLNRVRIINVGRPDARHFQILLDGIIAETARSLGVPADAMPDIAQCAGSLERYYRECGFAIRPFAERINQELRAACWRPPERGLRLIGSAFAAGL